MPIELIVGPPNSGRSEAILGRFRAALDRDPVLVVPTAGDVTAFERELCGGAARRLGGSIATFDALAGEIAANLAPAPAPELTVSQRQALVRAAIDSADPGPAAPLGARPGFAPALARLIAELEAALISPERVRHDRRPTSTTPATSASSRPSTPAYVELRERSGRGDRATTAAAAIRALRADARRAGARGPCSSTASTTSRAPSSS